MLAGSSNTTSMPHGANSCRNASAIDAIAALDEASGPPNGGVNRSPIEPMITSRPLAWRSSGRNAWVTATWPTTLTSSCHRSDSRGTSSIGTATPIPALSTNAFSPATPTCPATVSTESPICSALVTSISNGVIVSATGASASARTPAYTCQPAAARRTAVARPMPVEAPVTTTCRSVHVMLPPIDSLGQE